MKKVLFSSLPFIVLDASSKFLALRFIPPLQGLTYPFGGIGLFQSSSISFSLNLIGNTGVACGLFQGHPLLLLLLRLVMIIAFFLYLVCMRTDRIPPPLPLILIFAGAIGNVIDFFCYGRVIDFFHVQFFGWSFPIFNIADSCITCGVALLFFWPKRKREFLNHR